MRNKINIGFLLLLFIFTISTIANSGTTGKIAGYVKDNQTGEPLPGVNVVIEGTTMGAATDMNGYFFVINIPPGNYSVKATMIGYKAFTVTNVRVIPDITTTVDFSLTSEVLSGEVVTIVAERPLIQKDVTFSGSVTTAEEIENMPVNTFSEVLNQSGGIVATGNSATGTDAIHLRGGRSDEIAYMVDGFYVQDPYNGNLATDVVSMGVQDLSVISGTFNAEYGRAMSGIVNIVTKEGTPNYSGLIRFSTDQFGIKDYDDNTARTDATFSGPIPFLGSDVGSFFISGDYYDTDTYLRESKSHVHDIAGNPITRTHRPLTYHTRQRYNGKLVLRPFSGVKVILGYNRLDEEQRLYDVAFKEIPDHNGIDYNTSDLFNFTLTHALSPSTYYDLKASLFKTEYEHKLGDNLDDIVTPLTVGNAFGGTSNYEFYGTYLDHVDFDTTWVTADSFVVSEDSIWATSDDDFWAHRKTRTLTLMGSITSQIHKNHMIKLGFEYDQYKLNTDMIGRVNAFGIGDHEAETHYEFEPVKLSAYVQDKMEFKQFVVNAGIRLDYLDTKADYAPDLTNPYSRKKTKAKYRLSPRIGFAHPLTDKIRLHFAYGHFFQFSDFQQLYNRFNLADDVPAPIDVTDGYRPYVGNPNIDPQTTIAYEFGTEMALSDEVVADVTVFYKDIYDYIALKFFDVDPAPYFAVMNLDYANSRGVEFSLSKRFSNHYMAKINYTYSRAEGNADTWYTHADEFQLASVYGQVPPKKTVTLDWDQPHTLTFQFDMRWADNWGLNVLGRFGSGLPYTPTDARGKPIGEHNSDRLPWNGTVDVRLNKDFHFFGLKERLFMNIWNLFDKENILNVFSDSGKPDYSTNPNASEELMHRPEWYGPPRQIEIGLELGF